ncbi:MAG: NAD-dependent epimerase/dehydratase family protein, partial [Jatrophihabitans sp.]|uniref:NAD-dependent epimerase/dehydratase family protein n=1 Tax=Jatrophihabitans sp. TaxID=1932789 RepID=UPI003F7FC6DC
MAVVLITGVSRFLGAHLAAQLAADPAIDRVIGLDLVPPRADRVDLGRTEFVRADIRNPLVAKVIAQAGVTTVVHAGVVASPRAAGGRVAMQELNVVGSLQLFGACQRSDTVSQVVFASTAAVYGSSARQPAVLTETSCTERAGRTGYARDAHEVEGYVRGLARRRPDITTTVLRFADIVGPHADTTMTRYLSLVPVPTVLGFDPRLQLLHEDDAIEVLRRATVQRHPGVFHVAGDGVLVLSQLVRRSGAARLPLPAPVFGAWCALTRSTAAAELAAQQPQLLQYGRVLDTARLRREFGSVLHHSTAD